MLIEEEQRKKAKKRRTVTYVALGTSGQYYIRFGDGSAQWSGADEAFSEKARGCSARGVASVAFGVLTTSWFIVYGDGGWSCQGIPIGLDEKIKARRSTGDLKCVSLGPAG
eukprot:2521659-Prymnesium_polylepis.1